jgi:hypothetical protein
LKDFFKYRGIKIRYTHRNIWLKYHLLLFLPFLFVIGVYEYLVTYPIIMKMVDAKDLIVPGILTFLFVVIGNLSVFSLMRSSKLKGGYFMRVYQHQMLCQLLLTNNFYFSKKNKNGKERIILPKVYMKKEKYTTKVSFGITGDKFHERFLKIGKTLEEMFLADLIEEEREFGFINFRLLTDVIRNRIEIKDVIAKDGAIKIMEGVYWEYDEMPHMLVAGGTGGGKTYFLYSLIKAFLNVGTIDICDPKSADLADLATVPVFKGHVYYGKGETMIRCLKNGVDMMEKRFKYMKSLPNYTSGKNYAYYEMPPHFIFFDEWKAFYNSLDFKTKDEVDQYVNAITMKARQAGVFLILATQRPDASDFPAGVRDNLMCKVSLGRLSAIGYNMVFGDDNKNKPFYNKRFKGRGYLDTGSSVPQELYAPFVPKSYKFLEEFAKYDKMIEIDFDLVS